MYKFKNALVGLLGLLTLVVTTTVTMPHIGRGAVGNTNNGPTSQTQNVNVVNTPGVNAQQSGTWNVGINGTPSVNVANLPTTQVVQVGNQPNNPVFVRDVDNPTRQLFIGSTGTLINDGQSVGITNITIVPTGKVLVLEQISVDARFTGQKLVSASIFSEDQLNATHYLVPNDAGTDSFGRNVFIAGQHVRMYFTQGQPVSCRAERNGTAGQADVFFSMSGYFVDAP